jgi:DNA repair protein RecO (recombination protein O)
MRHRRVTFAISVHRTPFGETSQIAEFLTEDYGRISALARGSHRLKNSYQGPIDNLVYARIKFSANHGRGLDLLLERDVITDFPELRRDLNRYHAACYVTELTRLGAPFNQLVAGLFNLYRGALVALHDRPRDELPYVLFAFEWRFLKILGLKPSLDSCVVCGTQARRAGEVRESSRFAVSAERGGLVCQDCGGGASRFEGAHLELLRQMAEQPLNEWRDHPKLASSTGEIRTFLTRYLRYHLEHPLASGRDLDRLFAKPKRTVRQPSLERPRT